MVNDDGFIYKRRKRRVEADVFPIAAEQPEEDTKAPSNASLKQQRKKQILLAAKAK